MGAQQLEQPLSNENKAACVIRVVAHKLIECRLPEIIALRRGFHTIKWGSLVALFTGRELFDLMCGVASLEPHDLYDAFTFEERTRREMREWVRELIFEREETWRKRLLRFITGSFSLPRGGLLRRVMVR